MTAGLVKHAATREVLGGLNTVFGALLAKQKALGKANQEKTKKVHDKSGERLDWSK